MMKRIVLLLFFAVAAQQAFAQNLEKIGKKDMVTVSGGLNFSSVFYNAQGMASRREPFTWFFNGNLNVNILDVSLPFTYSYSNHKSTYTQPFNIQSVTPTWRWIKGYGGYTSMNFSPYTLAGHLFLGGGIELTPKNWKFAAMYGRLKKAVEYDVLNNSDAGMSYRRMGYSAKAGYEKNGSGISVIYFSAKDDPASLLFAPPQTQVTPAENTVVSVNGKATLWKKIRCEAEYALSGLTSNTRPSDSLGTAVTNRLPVIFAAKPNSLFFDAIKSALAWQEKKFNIALNYERIAPGYQTLGAYFFNNDLENFTIAPAAILLKGKMNLSVNTGLQRNNLDKSKLNTTKRWVNAINLSYTPNTKWNFAAAYSNFSAFTRQRPQSDPFYQNTLDTLNVYQLSQQANGSAGYRFGKKELPQSVQLSGTYQVATQFTGALSDPGLLGSNINGDLIPTVVLNGNLAYSISFTKSKTALAVMANANRSELPQGGYTLYWGPGLNVSHPLFKNAVKLTAGSTYNQVLTDAVNTSSVLNHRLALAWSPKMKNPKLGRFSFNLSSSYMQRLATVTSVTPFSEFTGNFGASYGF